ncbi:ABC transporter substrate-binding protein, partial [bacterium]|nr:ABC transporter substrate-binding protein [bacterium]
MKKIGLVLLLVIFLSTGVIIQGGIAQQLPPGIPREETLIIDQIFRYSIVNNFNLWVSGVPNPTRQSLAFDTLWYVDQQTGKWINALAKSAPIYNKDFTELTIKLRDGIYWSDGVKFTADDVVFTIQNIKDHPGLLWHEQFNLYVDKVSKTDNLTVVIKLKRPNSRFHYLFTARYNACYIQPKHIWEKVSDPLKFTFYPPVTLGQYVLKDSDPAGYWELYERRTDWQRTSAGIITRKAGPKYILTIFYGPNEKKVGAMIQHQLDLLMDLDIEAFQTLLKRNSYARSWYKDFPWAWRDELDIRYYGFNLEKPPYNIKDVRWALALALDIVKLNAEYIGGVTRVTPIPQPATPFHMKYFHKPLKAWLRNLRIEVEKGTYFKPFDESVPERLATWAKSQ